MSARPVYVGCGTCDCQRPDVRLYSAPGTAFARRLLCTLCLEQRGVAVPAPRTAEDLEMIDGRLVWKR